MYQMNNKYIKCINDINYFKVAPNDIKEDLIELYDSSW